MNCFIFRLPGHSDIYQGFCADLKHGLDDGFIFSRYGESDRIFSIPFANTPVDCDLINKWVMENDTDYFKSNGALPISTPKDTHLELINNCIGEISRLESDSGVEAKIIASRIFNIPTGVSATEIFDRLCKKYPDAAVFLFSTSDFGTWIGATPEVILERDGNSLHSVALAGTRPLACIASPWDKKNIDEQSIVTSFIKNIFLRSKFKPEITGPYTKRCGPVIHLETKISTVMDRVPDEHISSERELFTYLLSTLAPTPAISGFPRKEAMDFIEKNEMHSRQCYGGMVGIYTADNSLHTYATLRCGHYSAYEKRISLYAGGGITHDSDPISEWEETEIKLSTVASLI